MQARGPSPSERLDRLNSVERELLTLLGRGHTAKTIASSKGLSVAAVNERFRAARRKTGFASSREIARLLTAQENRHDFIGLASPPGAASDLHPDAPPSRRASILRRWRLPMITAGLLAVAFLAQQTSVPPQANTNDEGVVAGILAQQVEAPDMAALHAEAAAAPDPEWSGQAEAALTRSYAALPSFAQGIHSFTVTCSSSMCEVAGKAGSDLPPSQTNELTAALQSPGGDAPLPGFKQVLHHLGTHPDDGASFAFVTYWRRD